MKEEIVLFKEKKDCCGCGACEAICPKKAISMKKDEFGFEYPEIDKLKCVKCGLCKDTCAYQNGLKSESIKKCFAASSKEDKVILNSASGGIFTSLAKRFLQDDGIVYGCALEEKDNKLFPHQLRIDAEEDLVKIQGSKYVQSSMRDSYQQVKKDLKENKRVLYSGTPCQIASLKRYLKVEYENLYTIDIICHGTPSVSLFQDYVDFVENKVKGKVVNIVFRDKSEGWGIFLGRIDYINDKGKKKVMYFKTNTSSYYNLFLKSETYRENCYSCKYASDKRVSDITIGDYWGIEKEHPEYLLENGGLLNSQKGISFIMVNTLNGEALLEKYKNQFYLLESDFEKAARENNQLKKPSTFSKDRSQIIELYKNEGYKAVDKWFFDKKGIKKYLFYFYNRLPRKIQKIIKK